MNIRDLGYEALRAIVTGGAGDIERSVNDPAHAARELGWRAEQSLEDGLRLTWESLQEAVAG
jgi:nucleoside-diphosphate-sugar epimerase